ncbi:MAG: winged helix-turn-helix domain-containing protein [Promethearchaeota archaeon]
MTHNQSNIEELKSKIKIGIKFWLEFEKDGSQKNIMGSGWAKLLKVIKENEDGSLIRAAEICGYSYKYAWNILKRIETRTGMPVVETKKGGKGGGGSIKLNEWGNFLLQYYEKIAEEINKICKNINKM